MQTVEILAYRNREQRRHIRGVNAMCNLQLMRQTDVGFAP